MHGEQRDHFQKRDFYHIPSYWLRWCLAPSRNDPARGRVTRSRSRKLGIALKSVKFSKTPIFRVAIQFGGLSPTKAESSQLEDRSHNPPEAVHATLRSKLTFWSLFTNSRTRSPRNVSHRWARTALISFPTFLSSQRIKLPWQEPSSVLLKF